MLRTVGELAPVESCRSFGGEAKAGMEEVDDTDVPKGGVLGMAVTGREYDRLVDATLSFSRTFSASATIQLAIRSNSSVTLTYALVARI